MAFIKFLKRYRLVSILHQFIKPRLSIARKESNIWLKRHASAIIGHVLSIGSGTDQDYEGRKYRDYFKNCSSSDITGKFKSDLILDVQSMPEIKDESFDCVFCSGVLEHVDDYLRGPEEITRVLKPCGILLLGLPFRQALHMAPKDFWRFTEYGIRHMFYHNYEILDIAAMDNSVLNFPVAYWVKAKKL